MRIKSMAINAAAIKVILHTLVIHDYHIPCANGANCCTCCALFCCCFSRSVSASNLQKFNLATGSREQNMLKHAQPQPEQGCSRRLGHAHLELHVGACFVVPQLLLLLLHSLLFLGVHFCLPRFV